MLKLALALALALASGACNRGCTNASSSPHPPASPTPQTATPSPITTITTDATPDDSGVTVITFDDVTEKVWDVDAEPIFAKVDKEIIRRILRRGMSDCIHSERATIEQLTPAGYRLIMEIQIGPGEKFTISLGHRFDNTPLPKPFVELITKIEKCFERQFRDSRIYQELHGGLVKISYTPSTHPGGYGED